MVLLCCISERHSSFWSTVAGVLHAYCDEVATHLATRRIPLGYSSIDIVPSGCGKRFHWCIHGDAFGQVQHIIQEAYLAFG